MGIFSTRRVFERSTWLLKGTNQFSADLNLNITTKDINMLQLVIARRIGSLYSSLNCRCSGKLFLDTQQRALSTEIKKNKIEVEVKFPFCKVDEEKIRSISKLISIKRFTDEYFDNKKYILTTNDIWLRKRDTRWECKTSTLDKRGLKPGNQTVSFSFSVCSILTWVLQDLQSLGDRYLEIEEETDIIDYLRSSSFLPKVTIKSDLLELLVNNGYRSFCKIETTRKKYQYQDLTIDLDSADFGYQIGEIEIIVRSKEDILTAELKIQQFARDLGLNIDAGVPGKVLTYLQRFGVNHYEALRVSGLLDSKRIK